MEKKKLPEIIITGTPQELIEIETLLVMAGYNDGVGVWGKLEDCGKIICYGDSRLVYATKQIPNRLRQAFYASEIHKILHYIETGEIKEYTEDLIDIMEYYDRLEYVEKRFGKNKRIGDKPYTLKNLMSPIQVVEKEIKRRFKKHMRNTDGSFTATTPVTPKYHVRDWNKIEKEFKEWANPDKKNCIAYYSPTSQEEILMFFKKHFIK